MAKTALLRRLGDVDLRLLRVFHAVVTCGGVSAAEMDLNIGRSTISKHLTDLETRLGTKLCHRGPAGFSLTNEGERVYASLLQLFSAIQEFQSNVDDIGTNLTGNLAIAFFDKCMTNPYAKLPDAIRKFERIAPKVTIEVYVEPFNEIETGILNGRFQLGIVAMHKRSTNMDYHPLYYENMKLYCGKHHMLFGEEDAEITPDVVLKQKSAGFAFHSPNMMASQSWGFKRHAIVNNEEALGMMVLSGQYIGFLPDHYAKRFIDNGDMRALCTDVFMYQSDHYAIARRSPKMSRRVKTFLKCLQEVH